MSPASRSASAMSRMTRARPSMVPAETGKPTSAPAGKSSRRYAPGAHFDVVLCWNLPDYLDENLVKPVVGRLWSVLKPGGMLLAFFHTRDAGPDSPCHRFHIVGADTLEMQKIVLRLEARRGPPGAVHTAITDGFQLQRVFNNRHR